MKVDVAGFTGLRLLGKAAGTIQLSVMEEVRKTLKEHSGTQASIKKLEVHDLFFAWKKISDADLKPLMEKLVDSFAELPSPFSSSESSYTDQNAPELNPKGQLFLIATENTTTTSQPPNQAPSEIHGFASTPFLLLRISLDIETLNKLVQQHQATSSLKPATNAPDSTKCQSQQAPKPDDSKTSNSTISVYTSPHGIHCDDSFTTDQDCRSSKVPILQPDCANSGKSAENCVDDEESPLQEVSSQLPKMQARPIKLDNISCKDHPEDQIQHDGVVILELQDFQEQLDRWRPWVEEDGDLKTDLAFLFPAYVKYKACVSSSSEDDDNLREMVLLKLRAKAAPVQTPTTPHQKKAAAAAAASRSQQESSLRFRARQKGGLKNLSIGTLTTELVNTRAKQAVTFADDTQTYDDNEDKIFPSLKSWEIQDGKETQQCQVLSRKHKLQKKLPEADKTTICKSRTPQISSKHNWISTTKPTTPDSFSEEESGIMHNTMCTHFTQWPRELVEDLEKSKKDGSCRNTRNRHTWVIPKEMGFGGSALTDAQQIRQILRASHKTFADLSTFELLRLDFD